MSKYLFVHYVLILLFVQLLSLGITKDNQNRMQNITKYVSEYKKLTDLKVLFGTYYRYQNWSSPVPNNTSLVPTCHLEFSGSAMYSINDISNLFNYQDECNGTNNRNENYTNPVYPNMTKVGHMPIIIKKTNCVNPITGSEISVGLITSITICSACGAGILLLLLIFLQQVIDNGFTMSLNTLAFNTIPSNSDIDSEQSLTNSLPYNKYPSGQSCLFVVCTLLILVLLGLCIMTICFTFSKFIGFSNNYDGYYFYQENYLWYIILLNFLSMYLLILNATILVKKYTTKIVVEV